MGKTGSGARRLRGLLCGLVIGLLAQPGWAIVGGSGVNANSDMTFAGVVSISIGSGVYSGVLIGSDYVLTAAHVVAAQRLTPGNVTVNFNAGSSFSESITAAGITVMDGYTGVKGADGRWHEDLALIRLSSAADSSVPVYDIYTGTLSGGTAVTLVGYGASGTGTTGATSSGSASVKRVGQNLLDRALADDDAANATGYTGAAEIVEFDFDGNGLNVFTASTAVAGEAQYGGGDSGSPMFVRVDGEWQVLGIASYNAQTCAAATAGVCTQWYSSSGTSFGSIAGATSVQAYSNWISTTVAAVPEPHAYALMLAGLGILAAGRRRRGA